MGAGGTDGFSIARSVLRDLPMHLKMGGTAHIAALLLRRGRDLVLAQELLEWSERSESYLTLTLTAALPLTRESSFVKSTAETIVAHQKNGSVENIIGDIVSLYAEQGATNATWAILRVDRTEPGIRIIDLATPRRTGFWVPPE